MGSLPKPLIGLLLGTVAFFALWMVALKPSSSASNSGSQGGVGQYQSAIDKAHQAVTTSNHANAKLGAPTATTTAPATSAKTSTKAAPATKATPKIATKAATKTAPAKAKPKTATKPVSAAAQVQTVTNAIRNHKVLAVLFYNPAAADDQAMVKELASVPVGKAPVVKLSVPVSSLTQFPMITTQVSVVTSPTLVIVDAKRHATTLTGFAGTGEIQQRIADAVAAK